MTAPMTKTLPNLAAEIERVTVVDDEYGHAYVLADNVQRLILQALEEAAQEFDAMALDEHTFGHGSKWRFAAKRIRAFAAMPGQGVVGAGVTDLKRVAPQQVKSAIPAPGSPNAQEWILVGDRLPEGGEQVLAIDGDGEMHCKFAYQVCAAYRSALRFMRPCFYTHWMPLPQSPSQHSQDNENGEP